jgi:dephospho-CoA kinase
MSTSKSTLSVALTGGIGSGKSTVAKSFAQLGAQVLEADDLTHHLLETDQSVIRSIQLLTNISPPYNDRTLIFNWACQNKDGFNQLEQILHPVIIQQIRQHITKPTPYYHLIVIPLLFEKKLQSHFNKTCVVDCPSETQVQRTQQRDGKTVSQIHALMKRQYSRKARLQLADYVINNDQDTHMLFKQIADIHHAICKISPASKDA